ncbi:hypothetical protein OOU_Y34scaffold00632g1, partial [Pyricularia oryzae Y34]
SRAAGRDGCVRAWWKNAAVTVENGTACLGPSLNRSGRQLRATAGDCGAIIDVL